MSDKSKIEWTERVNAISINPDMAKISDIERMAEELSSMTESYSSLLGKYEFIRANLPREIADELAEKWKGK
jgi:hypothetical protein